MSEQDQPQRQVLRTHGRTHLPGGSDPIPGFRQSPLEFMVAYGQISDSGASAAYIDLATWATSSEDVFTLELGSGGLSAIHALAIHEEGVYRTWSDWFIDSATAGDTMEGELDVRSAFGSFWGFGNTQNGAATEVVYDNSPVVNLINVANLLYVGGPAGPDPVLLPALIFPTILNQAGNSYHVEFEILIERLATSYTSNTVSHTPV